MDHSLETDRRPDRSSRYRHEHAPRDRRRHAITLNDEGFPTAAPDAPKPSPIVFVSDESRTEYPWLPRRVIAGSVWRGPHHLRVRVDATGEAERWPRGTPSGRRAPPK